ncbi:aminotransferase class III-fold pyridoxal phosphate-dependent enzyme, partial [Staphylococcus warneri]|uniref:aminotransferase class III-fold pyridoxal phosphate-dependent enzyme n=1 Tax=Staphylococcus warneri TaxID=1292 RepID=UPI0034D96C0E
MNTPPQPLETPLKPPPPSAYHLKPIQPNKPQIIPFNANFHPPTIPPLSLSSQPQYQTPYPPLLHPFPKIHFPHLQKLKPPITHNTPPILLQPIQPQPPINLPPQPYLKPITQLCHHHNILFIPHQIQPRLPPSGNLFPTHSH